MVSGSGGGVNRTGKVKISSAATIVLMMISLPASPLSARGTRRGTVRGDNDRAAHSTRVFRPRLRRGRQASQGSPRQPTFWANSSLARPDQQGRNDCADRGG